MKGKFLSIFFLLNILELINSAIEIQDKIALKDYNMGNMNYSMEKDLGQCACDLSKFCDYKCDCATYDDGKKCVESYEYKDRMDVYLCKSRKEAFEYNKKNASINLKDHIHSLMCVQFDKTVDLGEFYKKDPEEPDTLAREWVNQFFPTKKEEGDFIIMENQGKTRPKQAKIPFWSADLFYRLNRSRISGLIPPASRIRIACSPNCSQG